MQVTRGIATVLVLVGALPAVPRPAVAATRVDQLRIFSGDAGPVSAVPRT
jgi:hypothetical protein